MFGEHHARASVRRAVNAGADAVDRSLRANMEARNSFGEILIEKLAFCLFGHGAFSL
jgi:hypothetical protein